MLKIIISILVASLLVLGCGEKNIVISGGKSSYSMDVCGDEKHKNPDHKKISVALLKLSSNSCGKDSFVVIVLDSDEQTYAQTAYDKDENKFILEYQDGSIDKHFQSVSNLNYTEILNALVGYSSTSNLWDQNIEWKRIQIN
jgi:hypothetical protein